MNPTFQQYALVASHLLGNSRFCTEYQELCNRTTRASQRRTMVGTKLRVICPDLQNTAIDREHVSRYLDHFLKCSARTHDTHSGAHDLSSIQPARFWESDDPPKEESKTDPYEEACLILENEGEFHAKYTSPGLAKSHRCARDLISAYLHKLKLKPPRRDGASGAEETAGIDRLRAYFDDRWSIDRGKDVSMWATHFPEDTWRPQRFHAGLDPTETKEPDVANAFSPTSSTLTPAITQETTMNKIIDITTKTLVNGTDISTMADSQIYDLIATQEREIVDLESIKAKPKKLIAEIAKRQAGIDALVAYLDSKE